MGKASREKGARGERRCCDWLASLGMAARRVGPLESGKYGKTAGWDVEAGDRHPRWRIQAKEVARRCDSIPRLLEKAQMAFVHFTHGPLRGKSIVVVDADDLGVLARELEMLKAAGGGDGG